MLARTSKCPLFAYILSSSMAFSLGSTNPRSVFSSSSFRPGMVAMLGEKVASQGMSIEDLTTSLRIGKNGTREFVIDALVSSPSMADMENLDSMIQEMSSLKEDLGLSHFDVFVHTGKNK